MTWEKGRQNTGYLKKKIFQFFLTQDLGFDMYVLRYPEKSSIPEHTDPVDGFDHYRFNFVWRKPFKGGRLFIEGKEVFKRWSFFRPDKQKHYVTPIIRGERGVLSIGMARRKFEG